MASVPTVSSSEQGSDHSVSSHREDLPESVRNGRIRSESSNSSNSASDADSLKDVQVVMRKFNKFSSNGHEENGDRSSISSAERREEELFRRRSASVLEVKEHAHSRLREELLRAQEELKLKDVECKKLARVQDQMGQELEELTASLFEEANKMVQDAHVRRIQSEKFLKESRIQVEVLQAEVTALKSMLLTSTPSMPNRHLHPQIDSHKAKKEFVKGHRRSTSHHNFSKDSCQDTEFVTPAPPPPIEEKEVDPVYFEEFKAWRANLTLDQASTFLAHIIKEDIVPCLSFPHDQLAKSVFACILNNSLTIEPVSEKNPFPRKCALTETVRPCKYRVRLEDSQPYYYITTLARNRIASVCDFFTYIRYITQGLVKSEDKDIYWELIRLRKLMCLARLGLS